MWKAEASREMEAVLNQERGPWASIDIQVENGLAVRLTRKDGRWLGRVVGRTASRPHCDEITHIEPRQAAAMLAKLLAIATEEIEEMAAAILREEQRHEEALS